MRLEEEENAPLEPEEEDDEVEDDEVEDDEVEKPEEEKTLVERIQEELQAKLDADLKRREEEAAAE